MSATLVVAVPLALLAIVTLLGFVGCGYPDFQFGPDYTDYSGDTVLSNMQCVGYWPLNETVKTDKAHDLTMYHNNGTYTDMEIRSGLYPWLENMAQQSAEAANGGNGKLTLPTEGIVVGDQQNGMQTTCMLVDGAFVQVDYNDVFNPAQFTVEAWVRVDWASTDAVAIRMVVDSRGSDMNGGTGFGIGAIPGADGKYHWAAIVGNGPSQPATPFTFVQDGDAIVLSDQPKGKPVYLAMTFDGAGNLTLFVDGVSKGFQAVSYTANTTQPMLIGAGGAFAGFRDISGGIGPLWPFVGAIQDVAIYSSALSSGDIQLHDAHGRGNSTVG
jgi:hypothetical protein